MKIVQLILWLALLWRRSLKKPAIRNFRTPGSGSGESIN
nr:MAG TPA: hypothetical protein [Caudoviricetes sp.]